MNQITGQIWIGNSHDAKYEIQALKDNGITAILNVAADLTNHHVSHREFHIAHCGLIDSDNNTPQALLSAVYQLMNLIRLRHVILVHCHAGQSRSVCVVSYTLYKLGQFDSFDEALDHVRHARNGTGENQGLVRIFKQLEEDNGSIWRDITV